MKHELYIATTVAGALRGKWEFEYAAKALAEAAEKQSIDRRERKSRWKAKYDEVMEAIKAKGLNVRESLANSVSNRSYGHGPTISVDDSLQADLIEAHQRVEIHDKAAEEYDAWAAVMASQGERRLQLTQADWVYFFGGLDNSE